MDPYTLTIVLNTIEETKKRFNGNHRATYALESLRKELERINEKQVNQMFQEMINDE